MFIRIREIVALKRETYLKSVGKGTSFHLLLHYFAYISCFDVSRFPNSSKILGFSNDYCLSARGKTSEGVLGGCLAAGLQPRHHEPGERCRVRADHQADPPPSRHQWNGLPLNRLLHCTVSWRNGGENVLLSSYH